MSSASPISEPAASLLRFEELLGRSERLRVRGLPFDELRELSRLYRRHSARLSRLRDQDADPDAIRHLNALCVRGYAFLYSAGAGDHRSGSPHHREGRGVLAGIPAALALTWRAQVAAWLLLALGAGIGGGLAARDPDALYALLPAGFGYDSTQIDRLWSSPEARAEFLAGEGKPVAESALFGSWLFTHNTEVGILSFAMGMLAGVPTVLLQLYNGLMLGAFTALFLRDPWPPVDFAAWLLPHAIPELTAITLCCAGGLMLGAAVALPGRRRRRDALRESTRPALLLLVAALPLFAIAAGVESFLRESSLGVVPRLAVAAGFAAGLLGALAAVRRLARARPVDTSWLGLPSGLSSRGRSGSPGIGSAPAP